MFYAFYILFCFFYRDIEQSFWEKDGIVEDVKPVIITSDTEDDDEDSSDEDEVILDMLKEEIKL